MKFIHIGTFSLLDIALITLLLCMALSIGSWLRLSSDATMCIAGFMVALFGVRIACHQNYPRLFSWTFIGAFLGIAVWTLAWIVFAWSAMALGRTPELNSDDTAIDGITAILGGAAIAFVVGGIYDMIKAVACHALSKERPVHRAFASSWRKRLLMVSLSIVVLVLVGAYVAPRIILEFAWNRGIAGRDVTPLQQMLFATNEVYGALSASEACRNWLVSSSTLREWKFSFPKIPDYSLAADDLWREILIERPDLRGYQLEWQHEKSKSMQIVVWDAPNREEHWRKYFTSKNGVVVDIEE